MRGAQDRITLEMTELYEILEVEATASTAEIRKSYRRLALRYHPDKVTDDSQREHCEIKFKEITHAYEILSDDLKRREYDMYGTTDGNGHAYPEYEFNGNPFEQFYGGGDYGAEDFYSFFGPPPSNGGYHETQTARTDDAVIDIDVTLEQLFVGKSIKFTRSRNIICPLCQGLGTRKNAVVKECVHCDGKGSQIKMKRVGPGMVAQQIVKCKKCDGEGKLVRSKDKCKRCEGAKVVEETKIMEFEIAAGSKDGEKIIFDQQLDEYPGKKTGDIVVVLHCQQHHSFRRMGDDLYCQYKVPLVDALCGFSRNIVKHLDGRIIKITTPKGKVVRPGEFIKVKGEGMPHKKKHWLFNLSARGDLYIEIDVEFPADNWYLERGDVDRMRNLLPQQLASKSDQLRQSATEDLAIDGNIDDYTDFAICSRDALPTYLEEEQDESKTKLTPQGRPECATQ
ncbi:J domain-containing protein [Kocuria palustris]|nr:J domain-containing protein [Kocuria palustris]